MAGSLEPRTPRSVREARAFHAVQVGSVAGAAFVLTTILAIAGAIGDTLPIITAIIMIVCVVRFATVTGMRGSRR